ncbi:MAG TPA: metal-sulfur cluster assembly factor [Candidatus Nanoarchaeia archaeon]|nr:metal-sulfur cluster assembly factor [Candidatus Nanoarchaeia archaeon]
MGKDIYGFDEDNTYEKDMEELEEEPIKEEPKNKPFHKLSGEDIKRKVRDGKIINALKKIKDPEIDLDIWTLGLIYDMEIVENKPKIVMTFTSPMCPFGPQIVNSVKTEIMKLSYDEPEIELVFNPLWEPSEEVKEMLGMG